MKPIRDEQRVYWDILVMFVILFVTFEVPYDLLVGWQDSASKALVDLIVLCVFLVDIGLNCFTARPKSQAGLWGWRNIAGLFYGKWSPKRRPGRDEDEMVTRQPALVISYLTSGWFIIDLLAVIPFDLIFSRFEFLNMSRTARFARTARMFRLLRTLRAIKAFRLFTVMENVFGRRPAVLRFFVLGIFVLWAAHMHACIFYFAETGNPKTPIDSYGAALHFVFVTFTTADLAQVVTPLGYWASVSSVLFGITFFGLFIGNFASFFSEMDYEQTLFEEKRQQWAGLFKAYPRIFGPDLRRKILHSLKERHVRDHSIRAHAALIQSLESELEDEVKKRLFENQEEYQSVFLDRLALQLTGCEADKEEWES